MLESDTQNSKGLYVISLSHVEDTDSDAYEDHDEAAWNDCTDNIEDDTARRSMKKCGSQVGEGNLFGVRRKSKCLERRRVATDHY
ncbi:hypothetical protein U1Q18_048580 [Sarracenia purpurea var. burkii]